MIISNRPPPLSINQWVGEIGRRALVMAELATHFHHHSQDLVQDSLLSFIKHYSHKPPEQWTPLFYGILRNQITEWKRQQARRSKWFVWFGSIQIDDEDALNPLEQIANSYEDNPAQLLANASDIKVVQQVLSTLPERQQQSFLLRAWEGLDIQTTAQIMSCSESSVKTHYSRALVALRSALNKTNLAENHHES
jgi:RNA polymerase sigma-70 factor, ECF subfamily